MPEQTEATAGAEHSGPVCVDAFGFLGMHHPLPQVRRDWKSFFVQHTVGDPGPPLLISLEQVGLCDDLVWRTPRAVQDAYYPFMDTLHTDAPIRRLGYTDPDLRTALTDAALAGLSVPQRLLVAFTRRHEATLVTRDPELLARTGLPVRRVRRGTESDRFAPELEQLYQRSLALALAPREHQPIGATT